MRAITRVIGFMLFFSSVSQARSEPWVLIKPSMASSGSSKSPTVSTPEHVHTGHIYLGVEVGASWAKLGKRKPKISYESGVKITDAYPLKTKRPVSVTASVNGGYEFAGAKWKPAIALGVGGYFSPNYHFKGRVIETPQGDPSSTLYNYKYKSNNARAIAEIKFTWLLRYISPFIDVGVGAAWNRAEDYKETAVDSSGYPPVGPFHSHTNNSFACQAGLGLSAAFNLGKRPSFQRERISVGYHYVYSGKTSFGKRGSAYPHHLDTGSLSSDDLYFCYIHLF